MTQKVSDIIRKKVEHYKTFYLDEQEFTKGTVVAILQGLMLDVIDLEVKQ